METLLLYLVAGAAVGLVAGLFGVGGGLIMVPALVYTLSHQGVPDHVRMQTAVGTSLAVIVVTSISSVLAHHRRGAVRWDVFARMVAGILAGAGAGAVIADHLPGRILQGIFATFVFAVAARMAWQVSPSRTRTLPGTVGQSVAGLVIGALSSMLGIGGGSLNTPWLTWCSVPIRNAVATSAAVGLPIAVAGAVAYMLLGLNEEAVPGLRTGYVYWPAWAGIMVASITVAPLGARLAHTLPQAVLSRLFAGFLLLVGIAMLVG